jgi:hypothetical protein
LRSLLEARLPRRVTGLSALRCAEQEIKNPGRGRKNARQDDHKHRERRDSADDPVAAIDRLGVQE